MERAIVRSLSRPPATGLNPQVRMPFARAARSKAQLTQVLPVPVSVPVTNSVGIRTSRLRNRHGAWRFDL